MRVSLFDHPDEVSVAELQHDLLLLPSWRRRQVLNYRRHIDQVQCAKAFLLLSQSLAAEYGMREAIGFEYGEFGKPMLRRLKAIRDSQSIQQVHFNLSHCEKGVMCVVDDSPVGCDIEVIPKEVDEDILASCFNSFEQDHILSAAFPQVEFIRLWTVKEALLKLNGIGLIDDLPNLLTSGMAENVVFFTQIFEQKGYVYTVAQ